MTANTDWLQRSLTAVWHPCTQMKHHPALPLVPVARAEGVWLEDFEGKRYLDGISSWWVNLFGHGNPRINAAITDQLSKLDQDTQGTRGVTVRSALAAAEHVFPYLDAHFTALNDAVADTDITQPA